MSTFNTDTPPPVSYFCCRYTVGLAVVVDTLWFRFGVLVVDECCSPLAMRLAFAALAIRS